MFLVHGNIIHELNNKTWLRDKSWMKGSPVRQSFAKTNIFSSLVWTRFFLFALSPRMWKRSRLSLSMFMSFRSFFSLRLSCIPSFYRKVRYNTCFNNSNVLICGVWEDTSKFLSTANNLKCILYATVSRGLHDVLHRVKFQIVFRHQLSRFCIYKRWKFRFPTCILLYTAF